MTTEVRVHSDAVIATIFNPEELEKLLEQYTEIVKWMLVRPQGATEMDMQKMHFAGFQADEIFARIHEALRSAHCLEILITVLPALIESSRRGQKA